MSPSVVQAESTLIDRLSHLAAGLGEGLTQVGSTHPSPQVHRDLPYGPDAAHRLDLWIPRGAGPHPIALYIHGGAFRVLSKDTHWMMARALARMGYLTANINYRLAPQHRYPCGVQDVLQAWTWLCAHGPDHGGDRSHMVAAGDSAGANLALSLSIATSWRRSEPWASAAFDAAVPPTALLAAYGVFQVSNMQRYSEDRRHPWLFRRRAHSVGQDYLGARSARHHPGWGDLADPLLFFENGPPPPDRPFPSVFLPVGARDPLLADSRRLHAALQGRNIETVLSVYPGARHGFAGLWWTASTHALWHDAARFLWSTRARSPGSA